MEKKKVLPTLVSVLLLLGCLRVASTQEVKNPHHMIVATVGEPETVDPAWLYDTSSGELCMNVYDTLLFFNGTEVDKFVPSLATDWTISEDGLTYSFKIRESVNWQDPAYGVLTPEDVEYSFERWMVQCRSGGPTRMILEPLLGTHKTRSDYPDLDPAVNGRMIDDAVESTNTEVIFHLSMAYAPFLSIIAQPWASILSKQWCIDHGDFPGFEPTYTEWVDYNNPEVSPLDNYPPGTDGTTMMGTGPYKFDYWKRSVEWSIVKFDDYWAGWPAKESRGYVERVTVKFISEWASRKQMFLAGDADLCYVPRSQLRELVTNWPVPPDEDEEYLPGIRCFKDLPTLHAGMRPFLFNLNISTTSPYMGVPGGLPPGTLHETGIPPDFFSDINVRKAFAYCFNYTEYIQELYWGEAIRPSSPMAKGLSYWEYCWDVDDPDLTRPDTPSDPPWSQPLLPNGSGPLPPNPMYYTNLTEAEYHFKLAWGGSCESLDHDPDLVTPGLLWNNGFTFDIPWWTTYGPYVFADTMKKSVERLGNPKFHTNLIEMPYPSYISEMEAKKLPLFLVTYGLMAEHPDPHNVFHLYMHSSDRYSELQDYNNATADALIEAGLAESDENKRIEIYWKLCNIYFQDCPSIPLRQNVGRHWERTWVHGWYYNPAHPGIFFYPLWKELRYGDLNGDWVVDMEDVIILSKAFGSYLGHPRWSEIADVDNNGVIDIIDVVRVAKEFGKTA